MHPIPRVISFCLLALSLGCGFVPTEPSKTKPASILTEKAEKEIGAIPVKAHALMLKQIDGTLVHAEYLGTEKVGFSGAGFRPWDAHAWSGFYFGKAAPEPGKKAKTAKPAWYSFKLRTPTDYSSVYDYSVKPATDEELRVLRSRGYLPPQ